ncbi:MAG: peptidase MA family metallohydrolase [Chloroflexota bacterium]|nr:peptidase MA family metallohydrolase [Chloroflexota bacterium]
MCRWKSWNRWSRNRIRGNKILSPQWRAVLALIVFLFAIPSVSAATPVHVLSTENDHVFSEFLKFNIEAEAEESITEAILFYGQVDEPLVRRIYPSFSPGKRVHVEHTEPLDPGQFAPGTNFRIWWELHTAKSSFRTATRYLSYTDNHHRWHKISGQRVDLYWYGNGESRAEWLLHRAGDALSRLEQEVGVTVQRRINIYVYNNRQDMQRAISPRSEGYDAQVMTLGLAVGEKTLLLLGPHRDVESTMAHELSHIVVGMSTDNPYTHLPRWLDEGLAMYAEGELPADNRRALDRAIRGDDLLSVRSMSSYPGRASEVDLFYGEVYSIARFLLDEYGRERMRQLLHLFSTGMGQEEALQRTYGFGVQGLDDRWRESLGLEPRPKPTERPSPQPKEEGRAIARALCPYLLDGMALLFGGAVLDSRAKKYP